MSERDSDGRTLGVEGRTVWCFNSAKKLSDFCGTLRTSGNSATMCVHDAQDAIVERVLGWRKMQLPNLNACRLSSSQVGRKCGTKWYMQKFAFISFNLFNFFLNVIPLQDFISFIYSFYFPYLNITIFYNICNFSCFFCFESFWLNNYLSSNFCFKKHFFLKISSLYWTPHF